MAGLVYVDPKTSLDAILQDIGAALADGQIFDREQLDRLGQTLEIVRRQIARLDAENVHQELGIIVRNLGNRNVEVAGERGTHYDVETDHVPNEQRKPGQSIRITPSRISAPRAATYVRQFAGGGGAVGQVTAVLAQKNGPTRLQLAAGLVVEATADLTAPPLRAGAIIRYDQERLVAFEIIGWVPEASGQVGEVADIYTAWNEEGRRIRRLHVRAGSGEGILVGLEPGVENDEFNIGDLVRVDLTRMLVLERLRTFDVAEVRSDEIGDTSYERIGGLEATVQEIRRVIEWPYLYPDVYRVYQLRGTKGILLYGPPGCGKTLIAKAIASNLRQKLTDELKKPEIQAELQRLIDVLELHKALSPQNPPVAEIAQRWRRVLEDLPPQERDRLLAASALLPGASLSQDTLHGQIKAYLLMHDIANLDAPDAEIGKIQELRDHDSKGSAKQPSPKAFFISISGPELLTKWVGETEHKIRKLFEKARRASGPYTPVILFLDEIESMFQTRGSGISSDVEKTIVPQFLAELDGIRELRNVIVIGASNRVELIDPALLRPGRLDRKIKIDRPNSGAAEHILSKYITPDLPLEGDASDMAHQVVLKLYDERSYIQITNKRGERLIAPVSQFVSGAALESIVTRAKKAAAERWIQTYGGATRRPVIPSTDSVGRISVGDLLASMRDEYAENKDHLALNLLEVQEGGRRRRPALDEVTVTVQWADAASDRWQDVPPYLLQ